MKFSIFSAALLATNVAFAATPVDGWYGSVFGGYAYLPDNVTNTRFGLLRDAASYDQGFNAGGRIGYKSNPLRYEGEYTFLYSNLKHFNIDNVGQLGVSGRTTASLAMANIYYDFPDMVPCVAPYLGVGLGYAHVQARLDSIHPLFGPISFKASDNVFAYQGVAGISYNFAENYSATLDYRYVNTARPENLGKIYQAHVASLGIVYRCDEARYK